MKVRGLTLSRSHANSGRPKSAVRINSRLIIFRIIIRERAHAQRPPRVSLAIQTIVFSPVTSGLEEASRRTRVSTGGLDSRELTLSSPLSLSRSPQWRFIFKTYSRQTLQLPDERSRRHIRGQRITRDTNENISSRDGVESLTAPGCADSAVLQFYAHNPVAASP